MNPLPAPPVHQLAANLPCWKIIAGDTYGIEIDEYRPAPGIVYKRLRTRGIHGEPHNRYFLPNALQAAQLNQCAGIPRQDGLVLIRHNALPMHRRSRRNRRPSRKTRRNSRR